MAAVQQMTQRGRAVVDPQAQIDTEFFTYQSARKSVAAGSTSVTDSITIQSDADFLIEKLAYVADNAGGAITDSSRIIPNIRVLLTSGTSSAQLMSVPVPISALFGTGQLPFILPKPFFLRASSTMQIQYSSDEAALTLNVQLSFIGRKVFTYGRARA